MAMSRKKKAGILFGSLVGSGMLIGLLATVAGAAEPRPGRGDREPGPEPEPDRDGYTGPGPNLPPGKRPTGPGADREPSGPSQRQPDVEAWDLWISPDCTDVVQGENWLHDTAEPAIRAWLADGFGRPTMLYSPEESIFRIVREIIGPYAPLCVESQWWPDVYYTDNPIPAGDDEESQRIFAGANERADAVAAQYPQLFALIDEVQGLARSLALEAYPGEDFADAGLPEA